MKWVLHWRYWEVKASMMSNTEGCSVVVLGGGEVPRSSKAPLPSCRLAFICAVLYCQHPNIDRPYVDNARPYDLSRCLYNTQLAVLDVRPGPYVLLFVSPTEYETSVGVLPPRCHYKHYNGGCHHSSSSMRWMVPYRSHRLYYSHWYFWGEEGIIDTCVHHL